METWYHALRSMRYFDEPALEVHLWIDSMWEGDPDDHSHRNYYHNEDGLKYCTHKFGVGAYKHFVQHMKDDGLMNEKGEWL